MGVDDNKYQLITQTLNGCKHPAECHKKPPEDTDLCSMSSGFLPQAPGVSALYQSAWRRKNAGISR